MKKKKFLILFIPFLILFLDATGLLYGQEKKPKQTLLEYDTEGKTPLQIATWLYENHGCATCHVLTPQGFGLTPHGTTMATQFEGCIGMMTTMRQTLTIPESQWNEKQKKVRANFAQFGCTVCHQVGAQSISLTKVGAKARMLHMSCPGVMSVLNQSLKK